MSSQRLLNQNAERSVLIRFCRFCAFRLPEGAHARFSRRHISCGASNLRRWCETLLGKLLEENFKSILKTGPRQGLGIGALTYQSHDMVIQTCCALGRH